MGLCMHGRNHAHWTFCLLLALASAPGCDDSRPQARERPTASTTDGSSLFDPATAGCLQGRVTWKGDIPAVPQFLAPANSAVQIPTGQKNLLWDNPNAPVIDSKTRSVANAVIFLRGVDSR